MQPLRCSNCNKIIVGASLDWKGKHLCPDCHALLLKEASDREQNLKQLYAYIQTLFGTASLSESVCASVEYVLTTGKTINGIKATLWYYYDILGNNKFLDKNLGFIIQNYYEAARKYVSDTKAMQQKNNQVDLDVPAQHVVVDPRRRKKTADLKYKMEDL